jgi:predicted acyl esterase
VDRWHLDRRSDGACFTTEALAAPLELLGRPVLELELEADQPGFDLCGALSVLRGGSVAVEQLSTGVARFLGPECLRRQRRRLELQPLLATLAAGDRLRLSLAAAAWPQITVNPGTGAWPLGGSGPGHRVITLQLKLDSALLALEPMASGTLAPRDATLP